MEWREERGNEIKKLDRRYNLVFIIVIIEVKDIKFKINEIFNFIFYFFL
jgi:hypothetical protein